MARYLRAFALAVLTGALATLALPSHALAQQNAIESAIRDATPAANPATLTVGNRPIIEFRASLLGRQPIDRVEAARVYLDQLLDESISGPVRAEPVGEAFSITVAGRNVFSVLPADADPLLNESTAEIATRSAAALQVALNEAMELRRPSQVLWAVTQTIGITVLLVVLLAGVMRLYRKVNAQMTARAEEQLKATVLRDLDLLRATRIPDFMQRILGFAATVVALGIAYLWLAFVLRRFPYTRPFGESLRGMMLDRISSIGAAILRATPELFTVAIIFLLTRFASRLVALFFIAIEDGRLSFPWIYAETAKPSRKLITAMLWLFGVAVAYPYLPGSDTDAFKGISVFIGLILSLGSSGLMNQIMSGFTVTYSRALRVGDFVKIGDIEGVVTNLDTLSTKVKTLRGEDVTIPNAVTVSQTVTNYTRHAFTDGVRVSTTVGIGYNTPWRQVQALLLLAASRSPNVKKQPEPVVLVSALTDFAITYTLLFCPDDPLKRVVTLSQVNANILDAFNEHGIQIMTPAYEGDPQTSKVVAREHWFDAPAGRD